MNDNWKPWFAWYPVELQYPRKIVWLRCVEYEEFRLGELTGAAHSGPVTIIHYRLPDSAPEFRMKE